MQQLGIFLSFPYFAAANNDESLVTHVFNKSKKSTESTLAPLS
jgi:hypothetical protein